MTTSIVLVLNDDRVVIEGLEACTAFAGAAACAWQHGVKILRHVDLVDGRGTPGAVHVALDGPRRTITAFLKGERQLAQEREVRAVGDDLAGMMLFAFHTSSVTGETMAIFDARTAPRVWSLA